MTSWRLFVLVAISAIVISACTQETDTESADDAEATEGEAGYLDELKRFYEKAVEEAPDDPVEWAKDDISRIGDWEYKIVDFPKGDTADIEARLNELGADRWEVYWVSESPTAMTFYLKKSSRSYLRMVPFSSIGRAITSPDSSE